MTPYYQDTHCTIYHGDCREVLPRVPQTMRDVLLTDPPWGVKTNVVNRRFVGGRQGAGARIGVNARQRLQKRQPIHGDALPFDPTPLLAFPRCILWGGHCFASRLPDSAGWLVWDKRQGIEDVAWPLSEAELAWTNMGKGVHVFRHRWFGLVRATENGEHFHPTQKPVTLMRWCLERCIRVRHVCDPYMGVGPTLIAAKELGIPSMGIEIEERYCEIAVRRLAQEVLPFRTDAGLTWAEQQAALQNVPEETP